MVETSCLRQSKVTWRYFVTAHALISIEFFPVTSSEKALLMAIWRCSLCCRAAEPLGGNSWVAFVRLSVECSVAPWAPKSGFFRVEMFRILKFALNLLSIAYWAWESTLPTCDGLLLSWFTVCALRRFFDWRFEPPWAYWDCSSWACNWI